VATDGVYPLFLLSTVTSRHRVTPTLRPCRTKSDICRECKAMRLLSVGTWPLGIRFEKRKVSALAAQVSRLSGDDWQNWANKLLTCHYGPTNYQKVPDNDRGDSGIEGFTIDEGHAYQAYGCEGEPLKTADRYEKQRDKLTADIGKFILNSKALQRIFGTVKITRWALLVPYYDSKEIVIHAAKKTEEVVAARLPYVADTFRVSICHEEDFLIARDKLINAGTTTLQVTFDPATAEQVTQWVSSNDDLSSTLEDKLRRLPTLRSDAERRTFHDKVLRWYLEGQAVMEGLRLYPDIFEKIVRTKSHRENFLVMAAIGGLTPHEILKSSIQGFLYDLRKEVRELHSFSVESLAYEAAADWLLRCPLNFPEVALNV
jgi:hypothetical protein